MISNGSCNDGFQGKRSISDHTNEAVKYIKHLEHKVKGLCDKRDKLKKLSNLSVVETEIIPASADPDPPTYKVNVAVRQCKGGLEVLLSGSLTAKIFPLSRIIDIILKEGLDVVNCISTTVEQRQIYTFHIEVLYLQLNKDTVFQLPVFSSLTIRLELIFFILYHEIISLLLE